MKYVLAGASGFLGKALTRDLVANGHQVVRLVRRTRRRTWWPAADRSRARAVPRKPEAPASTYFIP